MTEQGKRIKNEHFKPINSFITEGNMRFKLLKFIGRGAYAQVFETQVVSGFSYKIMPEKVALKIIKMELVKSNKAKELLESEIKIHSRLEHENIVKMYYSFRDSDFIYIVMEYCNGGALDKHKLYRSIKDKNSKHVVTEEHYWNSRRICHQIMQGIKYLHFNEIVHRDLKLQNIFVSQESNQIRIKLGDFGLSAVVESNRRRKTVCGTPNYIAPEVLDGKKRGHSYEADIWSFGIVLYTLVVGLPPFQEETVDKIYERIKTGHFVFPNSFKRNNANNTYAIYAMDILNKILLKNPEDRLTIEEIEDHRFFTTKQMNKISENKSNTNRHGMKKGSESLCEIMLDALLNSAYRITNIEDEHVSFSFPMNDLKCIGYTTKEGVIGLIYFNKDHVYLLRNCLVVGKLNGETERHPFRSIPAKFKTNIGHLKYFVTKFTSLNWNRVLLPEEPSAIIKKVSRVQDGFAFLMTNGLMVFDFSCGSRVVVGRNGKEFLVLSDYEKVVGFTDQIKVKMINVLMNHKRSKEQ